MGSHNPDSSVPQRLWLVSHEREDPMTLVQDEYAYESGVRALKRVLAEHTRHGMKVTPPPTEPLADQVGRRYDVSDASGWYATYWLSPEEISDMDGVLTSVISPGAPRPSRSEGRAHR